jgi:hypothetical protein
MCLKYHRVSITNWGLQFAITSEQGGKTENERT